MIGIDQKRARAAGRVEDMEVYDLLWGLSLHELSDRLPDDIVHDISGRVIDSAGFLDLGFVLDDSVMSRGKPDDFAEKLLVNLAENIGRENRKLIRTFWIIKSFEEITEQFVVNLETERYFVGRLVAAFFSLKIKKPGVVFGISVFKYLGEARIDVGAVC